MKRPNVLLFWLVALALAGVLAFGLFFFVSEQSRSDIRILSPCGDCLARGTLVVKWDNNVPLDGGYYKVNVFESTILNVGDYFLSTEKEIVISKNELHLVPGSRCCDVFMARVSRVDKCGSVVDESQVFFTWQ